MDENFISNLPKCFVQNTLGMYGEAGEKWLIDLPQIVKEIAGNWSLKVENFFPNLSYNFVAPCVYASGDEVVLKIGFPEENSLISNEARALEIFGGNGAVKLLQSDEKLCALLLEKAVPGEGLRKLCQRDDAAANQIAIDIMRRLWREPPENQDFPTLESWIKGFEKAENSSFPAQTVKKAQSYFDELLDLSKNKFVLHGDLHHANILSATREPFLAIDPKGIVGDIGYEISVFLNNPRGWILTQPDVRKILRRRVEKFSEAFEIEPRDLRRWAFAEAVLSAWWTFEDNGTGWKKLARLRRALGNINL
ncbi:MAG: aminoglycoside phosphotransferase family protein [Acidobacteria bacterium]|nr:aminoglycoside phosphotransferase family protein [Acidobacteriota bacterium]MCA1640000.1 aminoglycoside phosphotransferase family protein [Acidobacteriota bacterium]